MLVPEGMNRVPSRQFAGHEADLDKGPHALGQQAVVDLVDIGEVEDRIAAFILIVDAHFIVEDGVEADIARANLVVDIFEVLAVVVSQRQNGAARPEHLLPEMGEGAGRRVCVDGNGAGAGLSPSRATGSRDGKENGNE